MPKESDSTERIVIFSKILQILNFRGVRMTFPYMNLKGVTQYASIDATDLFKIVRWNVDASGMKIKPVRKLKSKVVKKK